VHLFDPHDSRLLPPSRSPLSGEETETARVDNYGAEVTWMDAQIGGLLAWLGDSGRLANTLVVVVADHGEAFGEHGWWGHGLLYSEQVRVPLLFMGPGVKPGTVVPGPTSVVDIVPTALDLLGFPPVETDGVDLTGALAGDTVARGGRLVYADALDQWQLHMVGRTLKKGSELYAISDGDWVYVRDRSTWDRTRLFRLPDEEADRTASDPGELARLQKALDAFGPYVAGEAMPLDPETRSRLDALGYAGE
jgi:arylsulfatase A-like enzyme